MCGYFGNLHESPAVIDLLNQLNIPLPYPTGQWYPRRWCEGLITAEENGFSLSKAMWWYQIQNEDGNWKPNEKITSFNARDLDKPLWRNAAQTRRGIVIGTEIGESQGKLRHLMRADEPFALGTLYKEWDKNTRSFSVITRHPHSRFAHYHEKSTPLFIPLDADTIQTWLCEDINHPSNQNLLAEAKLPVDFQVTPVKTYKHADATGDTQLLVKDEPSEINKG